MMNNLTWQAILKLTIRLMPIVRGAITSVMKEIAQKRHRLYTKFCVSDFLILKL